MRDQDLTFKRHNVHKAADLVEGKIFFFSL